MFAKSMFRSCLSLLFCCALIVPLAGCGGDAEPVYTSPDALDQYLEENPEEAYSSDGEVEEMESDTGEGE